MKTFSLILAAVCFANAEYPTTYPYENERFDVSGPHAETPSRTFDDADPGGYVYYYAYELQTDISWTVDGFFCFVTSGVFDHEYVVLNDWAIVEIPGSITPYEWSNCTYRWTPYNDYTYDDTSTFVPTSWNNELEGHKFCEKDECCKDMVGLLAGLYGNKVLDDEQVVESAIYKNGLCDNLYDEQVMCGIFSRGLSTHCIDQFITHTDRLYVFACYDGYYAYLLNCKVYMASGLVGTVGYEPEAYYGESTGEELNAWASVRLFPDKMCHPYSYYFPEFAKDGSSSEGSVSISSSEVSEVLESSSKIITFLSFAVLALIFN